MMTEPVSACLPVWMRNAGRVKAVVSSVAALAGGLCGLPSGRVQHVGSGFFFFGRYFSTLHQVLLETLQNILVMEEKKHFSGWVEGGGPCFPPLLMKLLARPEKDSVSDSPHSPSSARPLHFYRGRRTRD